MLLLKVSAGCSIQIQPQVVAVIGFCRAHNTTVALNCALMIAIVPLHTTANQGTPKLASARSAMPVVSPQI